MENLLKAQRDIHTHRFIRACVNRTSYCLVSNWVPLRMEVRTCKLGMFPSDISDICRNSSLMAFPSCTAAFSMAIRRVTITVDVFRRPGYKGQSDWVKYLKEEEDLESFKSKTKDKNLRLDSSGLTWNIRLVQNVNTNLMKSDHL